MSQFSLYVRIHTCRFLATSFPLNIYRRREILRHAAHQGLSYQPLQSSDWKSRKLRLSSACDCSPFFPSPLEDEQHRWFDTRNAPSPIYCSSSLQPRLKPADFPATSWYPPDTRQYRGIFCPIIICWNIIWHILKVCQSAFGAWGVHLNGAQKLITERKDMERGFCDSRMRAQLAMLIWYV